MKYLLNSFFLLSLLFLSLTPSAEAQFDEFLRVQNMKNGKIKRFYIGDALRFKTDDIKKWRKGTIESFDFVDQMIYFDIGPVRINEFQKIQDMRQFHWQRYTSGTLATFGVGTLIFSTFDLLVDNPYNNAALVIGPTAIGLGILAEFLLRLNHYSINKKHEIKLINTSLE